MLRDQNLKGAQLKANNEIKHICNVRDTLPQKSAEPLVWWTALSMLLQRDQRHKMLCRLKGHVVSIQSISISSVANMAHRSWVAWRDALGLHLT